MAEIAGQVLQIGPAAGRAFESIDLKIGIEQLTTIETVDHIGAEMNVAALDVQPRAIYQQPGGFLSCFFY